MTVVVFGIDALDPALVDTEAHEHLVLDDHKPIDTIVSSAGEPSTHELWPSIITGLPPAEHGLMLEDDGVAWGNTLLESGSNIADYVIPDSLQTRIGAWLLTNTDTDAFRTPASYYPKNGLSTLFDGYESIALGVPNFVVNPNTEDREHTLRRSLGDLFERDPDATGGHTSADPYTFYEQCMEMVMIRIARARRALRGGKHELAFAYTSGLDLIGHVTYDLPNLQQAAYDELDDFVGELRADLDNDDELLLVSDHGLQDGIHTEDAMVAGTDPDMVASIESVLDVRRAIEAELDRTDHTTNCHGAVDDTIDTRGDRLANGHKNIKQQLEDLGYM